jgi:hypothetical protein
MADASIRSFPLRRVRAAPAVSVPMGAGVSPSSWYVWRSAGEGEGGWEGGGMEGPASSERSRSFPLELPVALLNDLLVCLRSERWLVGPTNDRCGPVAVDGGDLRMAEVHRLARAHLDRRQDGYGMIY